MGVDLNPRICNSLVEEKKLNAPTQKNLGSTCYQCKRNDKGDLVHCIKCKKGTVINAFKHGTLL